MRTFVPRARPSHEASSSGVSLTAGRSEASARFAWRRIPVGRSPVLDVAIIGIYLHGRVVRVTVHPPDLGFRRRFLAQLRVGADRRKTLFGGFLRSSSMRSR